MRNRERISIFLSYLDEEMMHRLFIKWFQTNFEEIEKQIVKKKRAIKKYWLANHDERFSQVLVNMGFIGNLPGFWYYEEDDDILLALGCNPRDVLLWGQNFDKDMNRLPETNWIKIKDMSTDHIRAVISFMGERLPKKYKSVFQAELELRKDS
jgi:hypothetical protein